MAEPAVDLVIPTIGRPSLARLLDALADGQGPRPESIVLVDDRARRAAPLLAAGAPAALAPRLRVLAGRAAGPAAARNAGWRAARASWIAFLDDDVVPEPDWRARLAADLRGLPGEVAASEGRIRVPLPAHRRPTDWERNVAGLERARWATADLACRRAALERIGGFDERFPRAYREDTDLGLRLLRAGYRITRGQRGVLHPVRPADRWISVRLQAGNADDVLMRALHGRGWRARGGVPRGRRAHHVAVAAAGVAAVAAWRGGRRGLAAAAALAWLGGTAEFAWRRTAPGPRTAEEIATMLLTSVAIPPAVTWHLARGLARLLRAAPVRPPRAVLFDRDGTLVVDVPDNGDPARVVPAPGAREALARLRAAGVLTAVVSNQGGVARGRLGLDQVHAVNRRIDEVLGPLGPWFVCPHGPGDGCECRKPAPGLVRQAAAALGLRPEECAVIGDTGSDVEAARAAGARGVLVPNGVTRHEEIAAAPEVAPDLEAAVERLLGGRR